MGCFIDRMVMPLIGCGALVAASLGNPAFADALSPWEALVVSDTTDRVALDVIAQSEMQDVFGLQAGADRFASVDGSMRGVVNLAGPVGLVLDYSDGLPRMRGLSLTQGEHVRLEASGRIAPGLDGMSGKLSLQFRF